jgi:hypothetical protein
VRAAIEGVQQPELVFEEIAESESFAPHPPAVESIEIVETQHLVDQPHPAA